ncbi:MAG: hypothetical protein J6N51_15340, partial [Selenomonas sp.]|nr:hypothetical protein [Selenomonas sp.]
MQSLMSLLNHKKKAAVVASVLALSALTFSGCDASKEGFDVLHSDCLSDSHLRASPNPRARDQRTILRRS